MSSGNKRRNGGKGFDLRTVEGRNAAWEAAARVFEKLESRMLLSATLSPSGSLLVSPDSTASTNAIVVGLNSDGSSVDVTINGGSVEAFKASTVKKVVYLGNGDDATFTIDETNGSFTIPTRIYTGAGNDSIKGGSENDTVIAGNGNDTIAAGGGTNVIEIKGTGDDVVTGAGAAQNYIYGGPGKSTITAGSGDDVIVAGAGDNKITGGSGYDVLVGGPGNDTITAGSGNDTIVTGTGNDSIVGATGNDTVINGNAATGLLPSRPSYNRPTPPAVAVGTITGTVDLPGGGPAADAFVVLRPASTTTTDGFAIAPAITARTDSNGHFNIILVPTGSYSGLASDSAGDTATFTVAVAANATVSPTVTLVAPTTPTTGSGTVSGVIKDSSDAVVSGASVTLIPKLAAPTQDNSGQNGGNSGGGNSGGAGSGTSSGPGFGGIGLQANPFGVLHATTNSSGAFSLSDVPIGDYIVAAFKPGDGFAKSTATVTNGATTTVNISLPDTISTTPVSTGTVSGTVKDSTGAAVSGAHLSLVPVPQGPSATGSGDSGGGAGGPSDLGGANGGPPGVLNATTDSTGAFSIASVPVGTYTLIAGDEGVGIYHQQVTVTANTTTTVAVEFAAPAQTTGSGTITGTVKNPAGSVASGVTVTLLPAQGILGLGGPSNGGGNGGGNGGPSNGGIGGGGGNGGGGQIDKLLTTTTDSSGDYTFTDVPSGNYTLLFTDFSVGSAQDPVTVTNATTSTINVTLVAPPAM
jgi:hypothetical protein